MHAVNDLDPRISQLEHISRLITLCWDGGTAGNLTQTLLLQAGGFGRSVQQPNSYFHNMHLLPAQYRRGGYQGSDPAVWDWELAELPISLYEQALAERYHTVVIVYQQQNDLDRRLCALRHYWSNWRTFRLLEHTFTTQGPSSEQLAGDYVSLKARQAWQEGIITPVTALNRLSLEQARDFVLWVSRDSRDRSWLADLDRPELISRAQQRPGCVHHIDFVRDIIERPQRVLEYVVESRLGLQITAAMRETYQLWLQALRHLAEHEPLFQAVVPELGDLIGALARPG